MTDKNTTVNEWKNGSLMCEHSDTQCERLNTSVVSVARYRTPQSIILQRVVWEIQQVWRIKTDSSFLQIIESYQSAPAPMSPISMSTAVYIRCVRCVKCKLIYPCGLLISRETHLQINTFNKLKVSFKTGKSAAHSSARVVFWCFLNDIPESQTSETSETLGLNCYISDLFIKVTRVVRMFVCCLRLRIYVSFRMAPSAPQAFFGFCVWAISVRGNTPADREIEVSSGVTHFNPGPTALHISLLSYLTHSLHFMNLSANSWMTRVKY